MFTTLANVESFIREFEAGRLPKSRWNHQAHLVVGFWYTLMLDANEALEAARKHIRKHNESVGTPNTDTSGYHETITSAYLAAIRNYISGNKDLSFEESLSGLLASPLSDTAWLLKHYSRERLFSVEARQHWVEPDLLSFGTQNDA